MEHSDRWHIGMRNVKTALSVLACLLIYQVWGREGSFLAAASAIICMQDSVEKSVSSGISRFFGTFLGALCGMAFLYLDRLAVHPYLMHVVVAIGIMVLITLCNAFKQSGSSVIGCVVYLVIVLEQNAGDPLLYSANRLLDTLIGIVIAIIINRSIRPPKDKQTPLVMGVDTSAGAAAEATGEAAEFEAGEGKPEPLAQPTQKQTT